MKLLDIDIGIKECMAGGKMIKIDRYALRWMPKSYRGFWFQTFKPSWYHGKIRYITLGLWFFAFYAGDPPPDTRNIHCAKAPNCCRRDK